MVKMTEKQLRELCYEWKEMSYAPHESYILARGRYNGFDFIALNIRGIHPCGYVNVALTKLKGKFYNEIDIQCHGGLTFSGRNAILNHGWWIGWDYAHYGDFLPYYRAEEQKNCVKYTTADVVQECVNVIEQIPN